MGHSQMEKAASRERILAAASAQIRSQGLESLSVGKLMADAGLTHGGFYGHFASRADLLAQALERALVDGEGGARAASREPGRLGGFARFVRGYLSRAHRDAPQSGCAISALACDVGRADDACRESMAAHVEGFIAGMTRSLGGDEAKAMAAVSAMVGALTLSRVLPDPNRSDDILRAVREIVTGLEVAPH
jgi:TetR/AcrR family transcriptional repressor of nem operon